MASGVKTSSRTKPNALRRSRPGLVRWLTIAAAKGLFLQVAVGCGRAGFGRKRDHRVRADGSTLARPRPIARDPIVRFMVLANGLSRQASRMTSRSCLAGSTVNSTRSSGKVSSRTSVSRLERRVDRDQIIGAVQFNAMAGIIDHRHVGITRPVAELAQRLRISLAFRSSLEFDGVEACRLEHGRNSGGIVGGIAELRPRSGTPNCRSPAPRACRPAPDDL